MLTVLVWNMGLGSPPAKSVANNFERLWALMTEEAVDVALLSEASVPLPTPGNHFVAFSEAGTLGLDRRKDTGEPVPRPWSTAIVSRYPLQEVHPVAVGSGGRRPNVPFKASKSGAWTAAAVEVPEIGLVTCVSLYGLMDELSDASVHRSLSDLGPLFTDPQYRHLVLVGGDLNSSTQWKRSDLRARDRNLLERFKAYGLTDCLAASTDQPLDECTCDLGPDCLHSWTRYDENHPALQVDYLFASQGLAKRMNDCRALPPPEWREYSDHAPIVATFE